MSTIENLTRLQLPAGYRRELGVYWKPSAAFVDELVQFLGGARVLEVFAGNGYLAALLAARGINIKATTRFAGHDGHDSGVYFDVEGMDAITAVRTYGRQRDVLLMSWPTVTPAALSAVEQWGADKDIVYIGEVTDYSKLQLGGCATDAFFEQVRVTRRFESYKGNFIESALVGRFCPMR